MTSRLQDKTAQQVSSIQNLSRAQDGEWYVWRDFPGSLCGVAVGKLSPEKVWTRCGHTQWHCLHLYLHLFNTSHSLGKKWMPSYCWPLFWQGQLEWTFQWLCLASLFHLADHVGAAVRLKCLGFPPLRRATENQKTGCMPSYVGHIWWCFYLQWGGLLLQEGRVQSNQGKKCVV